MFFDAMVENRQFSLQTLLFDSHIVLSWKISKTAYFAIPGLEILRKSSLTKTLSFTVIFLLVDVKETGKLEDSISRLFQIPVFSRRNLAPRHRKHRKTHVKQHASRRLVGRRFAARSDSESKFPLCFPVLSSSCYQKATGKPEDLEIPRNQNPVFYRVFCLRRWFFDRKTWGFDFQAFPKPWVFLLQFNGAAKKWQDNTMLIASGIPLGPLKSISNDS